jgi:hypothetical protein
MDIEKVEKKKSNEVRNLVIAILILIVIIVAIYMTIHPEILGTVEIATTIANITR